MREIALLFRREGLQGPGYMSLLLGSVIIFLGCFVTGCQEGPSQEDIEYGDCLSCHSGIEKIGPEHDFECVSCHLLPEKRTQERLGTHKAIIRNPSDPEFVRLFCLSCHREEIERVEKSLHSTLAGIINQTRYLWGAQKRASPGIHGLSGPFKPLPKPDPLLYPERPRDLVDDFLRRRCLRCHLHTEGSGGYGLYRASGCAACHVLYQNDGTYQGGDKAIKASPKGYPEKHVFTSRIPNTQCLHCHNANHVGADYVGLFERDYSRTYQSPLVDGKSMKRVYGLSQHRLAKDVHAEKGLWCTDCHTKGDVMGNGRSYSYEMAVPKRDCSDCHGGFERETPDPSIPSIRKKEETFKFVSKNSGREYRLSLFSVDSPGHCIPGHTRVRCSACHAQWSYQDYGLSVIREDMIRGRKWHSLHAQGDPYLEGILKESTGSSKKIYPVSKDRITGEPRRGIWSKGWRFRRWEYMPLGVDHQGNFAVLRPMYQYEVSYVDRLGQVPLDSVAPSRGDGTGKGWAFMPYVPHTIAPFGKGCDRCHLNRMAAGLGIQEELTGDTRLTVPSPPAVKEMRLLNQKERGKLLEPSKKWAKERLRSLLYPRSDGVRVTTGTRRPRPEPRSGDCTR